MEYTLFAIFFAAIWSQAVSIDICEMNRFVPYNLKNTGYIINSPNYPSNYTNMLDCYFTIAGLDEANADFAFTAFNTEKRFDWLTIHDGTDINDNDTVLYRHSGDSIPFINFTADGNEITVRFTTDRNAFRTGFKMLVYDKSSDFMLKQCMEATSTRDHDLASLACVKMFEKKMNDLETQAIRYFDKLSAKVDATAKALEQIKASMITKDYITVLLTLMYDRR